MVKESDKKSSSVSWLMRYRKELTSQGLCIDSCGNSTTDTLRCTTCAQKNKKRKVLRTEARKAAGLCVTCSRPTDNGYVLCIKCRERQKERYKNDPAKIRASVIRRSRFLKQTIIEAYGGECVECSEKRIPCLELHHINNNGAEHRRQIGQSNRKGGTEFYRWVISNNFPPDLQLLCANCHAVHHYGESRVHV